MNKKIISLKDFEITPNENIIERSQNFQSYIDPMEQFGSKSYWVMARMGVGAKM
jgi:aminotransferase, class I/II